MDINVALNAGYVFLTLVIAVATIWSLFLTRHSLKLTRQQIDINKQQSNEALAAIYQQIEVSKEQAEQALYNQHKPFIVPLDFHASDSTIIHKVTMQNKGAGVALNAWGILTVKEEPREYLPPRLNLPVRYCFIQTYILVPDKEVEITFKIGEPAYRGKISVMFSHDTFAGFSIYPLQDATHRVMMTYNDIFGNIYLAIFDYSDELGWQQIDTLQVVKERLDEVAEKRK